MIRFSAWGIYLLLVPQGRALIRDRALISFLRNNQMFKKTLIFILKRTMTETVTVTNTVLTVNVQLTWGTYLEADNKQLLGTCRYMVDVAFPTKSSQWEQSATQGDWKTNSLSVDPSSPEQPAEQSPQKVKKRSFVWRVYAPSHGHKTTVFVMWHYRSSVSS